MFIRTQNTKSCNRELNPVYIHNILIMIFSFPANSKINKFIVKQKLPKLSVKALETARCALVNILAPINEPVCGLDNFILIQL